LEEVKGIEDFIDEKSWNAFPRDIELAWPISVLKVAYLRFCNSLPVFLANLSLRNIDVKDHWFEKVSHVIILIINESIPESIIPFRCKTALKQFRYFNILIMNSFHFYMCRLINVARLFKIEFGAKIWKPEKAKAHDERGEQGHQWRHEIEPKWLESQ